MVGQDIRHHFVRDQVASGTVEPKYSGTKSTISDSYILRKMAGVMPIPTHLTHK